LDNLNVAVAVAANADVASAADDDDDDDDDYELLIAGVFAAWWCFCILSYRRYAITAF